MALAYRRDEKTTEASIPATDARVHFGELVRDVETSGEAVLVERNGRPVVAVLPVEEFRRLQRVERGGDWRAVVRASQEAFRPFRERGVRLNAAELIREGRDDEEDYRNWDPDALPRR